MSSAFASLDRRDPYAVPDDLVGVGIPSGALEDVSFDDQMMALRAASDVCDSYLRDQYTTPLAEWAYDLRAAVCAMAAYTIICRRGYNPEGVDVHFRMRYDDSIAWLKDVARGMASLAGGLKCGPAPLGGPSVTSTRLRGW